MDVNNMTKKDFLKVKHRKSFNENIGAFDSLILIPTRRKHDSDYMCMEYIAVKNNKPLCRIGGYSDVLHIDGIGGYGKRGVPILEDGKINIKGWSIDCLKSGYLRLFTMQNGSLTCGCDLSSMEVFSK